MTGELPEKFRKAIEGPHFWPPQLTTSLTTRPQNRGPQSLVMAHSSDGASRTRTGDLLGAISAMRAEKRLARDPGPNDPR
jgi:hypothetical protein